MSYTITLLPGDGIGPEVTEATLRVLDATGVNFTWERIEDVGAAAVEKYGEPLPGEVVASIERNKVALKGPITTPVGKGFKSVNVQLRQKLDLYANVRPCSTLPGIPTRFENVDLVNQHSAFFELGPRSAWSWRDDVEHLWVEVVSTND